jgi:glycosyltransferase involved in cell wall biosynthesis
VYSWVPWLSRHGIDLKCESSLDEEEYAVLRSEAILAAKALVLSRAAIRALRRRHEERDGFRMIQRLRFLAPLPGFEPAPSVDIYDFDDALFAGPEGSGMGRFGWLKRQAAHCHSYIRRARLTIAGNSYLASRARAWSGNVEVVPSCVDPSAQPLREHHERETVTVGWIGSRTTTAHLRLVLPVIEKLNSNRVRAKLVVVGAEEDVTAPWIETRPWTLGGQAADLASFDIGIMPMPDNEWTRGKCGYKILQYFAAGVPAIASPVGVNRYLVGDERGRLAASDLEWQRALEELIDDAEARREMGAAARVFVEREFAYRRWAPELAAVLRSLA